MSRAVEYQVRPLGPWTEPVTTDRRSASTFRATWEDTLRLLRAEVEQLGGDLVVVQVDVSEAELRRDGMLRTHARVGFPGVRVSFRSTHGPLTYATDAFEQRYGIGGLRSWQANVRAIALSLGALRAVDRYGVTRRGEQYTGWQALPSQPTLDTPMTAQFAAQVLADGAGGQAGTPEQILADPAVATSAYRAAVRRHHPDVGGDAALFRQLTAARDLLQGRA